jgi:Big-like domain-containing protein
MHQLMRRVALGLTLPLAVGAPVVFMADAAHAVVMPYVTLTSPSNPAKYGEVVHLNAHVWVGEESNVVTAGSVQFRVDSVEIGGPVHLNAAGNAVSPPLFDEGGVLDVTIGSDFYSATAEFIPDDPMVYTGANAPAIQQRVDPAGSSLAILPSATALVADLSGAYPGGVQEGSAPPSGTVHFLVGGQDLVAPIDPNTGRATLNHVLPPGPQTVTATYSGDSRYTGTSESLVRKDPTLQARVLPNFPRTRTGWYHSAVRVWFVCQPAGSELVEDCPPEVLLRQSGKDQTLTRSIHAVDGGSATVTVGDIDIDLDPPVIKVNGRTCTATDKLSGVKGSCHMRIDPRGHYRAIANDKAGNRAVKRGTLD